jgi:site-specific recombinase XerC
MTVADFIERKFVPEYVFGRATRTRLYFQAILKYIVSPSRVSSAFGLEGSSGKQMKDVSHWPFMDAIHLADVTPEAIQNLLAVSIEQGYSARTTMHIRDVIRNVFSYAELSGDYVGINPATLVVAPTIERKQAHLLSLGDLRQMIRLMGYPERSIAIFILSTDMNVSEICGLQWKYANLTFANRPLEDEMLPPRSIAIRNQSYRGVFEPVKSRRRRVLTMGELAHNELTWLKRRERFVSSEDFVIASRTGTPILSDNVALRKLKAIGRAIDVPWLSWRALHRTRMNLIRQFGRYLNRELERALT